MKKNSRKKGEEIQNTEETIVHAAESENADTGSSDHGTDDSDGAAEHGSDGADHNGSAHDADSSGADHHDGASQNGGNDIPEAPQEGKKPKKKKKVRGCLSDLMMIPILLIVVVVLVSGSKYIMRRIDPIGNNKASVKYKSIDNAYWMASSYSGFFGDKGRDFGVKYLSPTLCRFFGDEESPEIGNKKLEKLRKKKYTLEDEDLLESYNGRKVSLTGKVAALYTDEYGTPSTLYLVTDVNADVNDDNVEKKGIRVNYFFAGNWDKVYLNACVEVEGILMVDPGNFKKKPTVSVWATDLKRKKFQKLGGNAEEAYLYQPSDTTLSISEQGVTVDILGVVADKKSGKSSVRFRIDQADEENEHDIQMHAVLVKGSWCGETWIGLGKGEPVVYTACQAAEQNEEILDELDSGEDNMALIFCGYYNDGWKEIDYPGVPAKKGSDVFFRVDIPKDKWTVSRK